MLEIKEYILTLENRAESFEDLGKHEQAEVLWKVVAELKQITINE